MISAACKHCENGVAINSNFRTEEPCRHCQPVGEVQGDGSTEEMDEIHQIAFEIGGDDDGGYQFTAEELEQFVRTLAARQPGAQGPVASIDPRHLFLMAGKDGTLSGNVLRFGASMQPGDAPLYAAPPAQGIDLGPDTFFVQDCPGWPGGISLHSMGEALRLIQQHGNSYTKLSTYRHQHDRVDYTPEQTRALIDQRDAAPEVPNE